MTSSEIKHPLINKNYVILLVICIVAICGIVYELLISTAASYLLGDSVKQFSVIIGIYMSSMGLGAYLTKYINDKLLERFIQIEILLSFVGGISIILIFALYSGGGLFYQIILYSLTLFIGTLVGFEIPLVIRIMEKSLDLKDNVAYVLTFDYVGGLIGSVAFPLLLLPSLGIMQTALLIGFLNLLSALWMVSHSKMLKNSKVYLGVIIFLGLLLIGIFLNSKSINDYLEQHLYKDKIIHSEQTPYQKIVITEFKKDVRLFIDGNLQFSSMDEYRYHESLVHIPLAMVPLVENVLILGGGDGLAVRELLKYKSIKSITLVDLDKEMTDLFKSKAILKKINDNSLNNPKVKIVNQDAMEFIKNDDKIYDFIIVDLPDPRTPELSKLFSKQFYELVKKHLSRTGIMVTQATSPFFARKAFWCIAKTVKESFPYTSQYHTNVLSFGDWGYVLGSNLPLTEEKISQIDITIPTKYFTNEIAQTSFLFGKDSSEPSELKVNTLFDPVIVEYYKKSWESW